MFMFSVRRFSTKGNLYSTLNEFALFKKKYEEVMPDKTLQIVDMSQGASSTIYYKVKDKNNGTNHITDMQQMQKHQEMD